MDEQVYRRGMGQHRSSELTDGPPIACSLTGGEYTGRVDRWRRVLAGSTPHRRAGGGVRTALDVDRLPELAALIVDETRCCPFFTFTLTVTHAGVQLDAAAPDDARPLLDGLFLAASADCSAC
jgi:MerR family transcriptional regulator, copper efflux regulator